MAVQTERGIPLSALNPKFLHTNSTSHTWPFSAIAELIDNAYDPDVSAKQFWIDKTVIRGQDCLTFMDNGAGMDYDKMFKMLSFGFSDKETINGHVPVGLYGNGFKSGSMRLGKDTIVFSKNKESMCVGMLSQTYLQEKHAENVIVPIVLFKRIGESIQPESQHIASLQDILRYSLFQTEEELHCELNAINAHYATESTGTRIIIWNLRKTSSDKSSDKSEFDFDTDRYDIQIPSEVYESEKKKYKQPYRANQSSPESDFSLRAYCKILYLKPKMHIIIRGQKVKTQLISKSLAHIVKDKYKPSFLNRESIPITFGYNTKSREHYGVMMYHKNRLIKAYERVGCQNRANEKGVGVIAVIECNFLKPTHNKQDFDYTDDYRKTMYALGVKLEEYWKAIRHKKGSKTTVPFEDIPKRPDQSWVQCDDCMKWRKLQDGFDMNKLPEKWFCRMNPDPQYRHCDVPEEAEDSEDESSACLKEYKQHERNLKKQQEQRRFQEEARLRQEQQKNTDLIEHNRIRSSFELQLHQRSPSSPRSPTVSWTATSPFNSESASSPSDNMPLISNVRSLSTPKRHKRNIMGLNQAAKRARTFQEYCDNAQNSPSTSAATSVTSPLGSEDLNNNNTDENDVESSGDDDIVIDEIKSTPRPSNFDLSKVKTEDRTSDKGLELYMECSDHVSMETEPEDTRNTTMETSTSNDQVSIMTQTERLIVKSEEDQQIRQEDGEIKREETGDDARRMQQSTTEVESKMSKDTEINVEIKERSSLDVSRPNFTKHQGIPNENNISLEQHAKSEVAKNQEDMTSKTSMTSVSFDNKIDLLPTSEAQKQQDNLLELLEATAQERDKFKEEVLEKEIKLLTLTVKKDCSHQSVQTDPLEEEHYKSLYLQAKQCIQEITKERDELKINEKALQIKVEKEAQEKVDRLEQEKASYRQLQKEVEELRKQKEEWSKAKAEKETLNHVNTNSEETCSTSTAVKLENKIKNEGESNEKPVDGDNAAKLRELRFNVARLLVSFVPALDLNQVNYDCEVIDEILNQVVQEIPPS